MHYVCEYRKEYHRDDSCEVEIFFDECSCFASEEVEYQGFGAEADGSKDKADADELYY